MEVQWGADISAKPIIAWLSCWWLKQKDQVSTDRVSLLHFIQVSCFYSIFDFQDFLENLNRETDRFLVMMTSHDVTSSESQKVKDKSGSDHQHRKRCSLFSCVTFVATVAIKPWIWAPTAPRLTCCWVALLWLWLMGRRCSEKNRERIGHASHSLCRSQNTRDSSVLGAMALIVNYCCNGP